MRTRTIKVDIDKKKTEILKYKQYDHNVLLKVVIYKNNQLVDLSSYEAKAFFKLPNDIVIQRNLPLEESTISIMLESIILEHDGKVSLEITLSNESQVVTIFTIYLDVEESIDRNVAIEGSPQWDIVKDGLASLDQKVDKSELEDVMDEYFEKISLEGIDLSDYVTKDELDETVNNMNLENYYTKEEIDIKIDNVDLTDYYTKEEVDEKIVNVDLTGYAKLEDLNNKANNLFSTDMLTVSPLGGISAGTNLNNMSIQDVLTKLLYPYVKPVISASITYSPTGGVYEFGQTVTVSQIKATITKKSEKITSVKFYQNGLMIYEITRSVQNGGNFNYTFPTPISINSSINNSYFHVDVTDANSETVTANTVALNFYYPYYYGVIGANVSITENLIKGLTKQVAAKGTKSYTYNPNYQRMVMAYPKSYGKLKSILDPNGFEQLNSFDCIEISIVGLNNTSQPYYVYVNDASTNTNFKMNFYY